MSLLGIVLGEEGAAERGRSGDVFELSGESGESGESGVVPQGLELRLGKRLNVSAPGRSAARSGTETSTAAAFQTASGRART